MKILKEEMEEIGCQLSNQSLHIAKMSNICMWQNGIQEWDIEAIQSSIIKDAKMVTRSDNNERIIIGSDGLYNIIVRFGYDYGKKDVVMGPGLYPHRLCVNGKEVAVNFSNSGFICFNEYLSLKI